MCGIVGYIGNKSAEHILTNSLKKLEYRGYDSAGLATLNQGKVFIQRCVGRIESLCSILKFNHLPGNIGIAHTRWASHGQPLKSNAHPHQYKSIIVVHNGIIENYEFLKRKLVLNGHKFESDTDTEVVAHLISNFKKKYPNDFPLAVRKSLEKLEGAYALAILDSDSPDTLIGVRQSCPLIIGIGKNENFLASDFLSILDYTRKFSILENAEMVVIKNNSFQITDFKGVIKKKKTFLANWSHSTAEKGKYKHFMLKEIFEQPRSIIETVQNRFNFKDSEFLIDGLATESLKQIKNITIVACGSSYHAALIGKRYLEEIALIPTEIYLASEFRYQNLQIKQQQLVIGISQSGETADTLAALQLAKSKQIHIMAICNTPHSAISRFCSNSLGTLYTKAGPEISVASTKAFVAQVIAFYMLAISFAKTKNIITSLILAQYVSELYKLPILLEKILLNESNFEKIAKKLYKFEHIFFTGRGFLYPIALEGALKVKEIAYIHAEACAAGEMKHGPMAMIDNKIPVIVLTSKTDYWYKKSISNLEELKSRSAQIIVMCTEDDNELKNNYIDAFVIPNCFNYLLPIVAVLPIQIFAYHLANFRKTNIDQPRNLAKSVTIE